MISVTGLRDVLWKPMETAACSKDPKRSPKSNLTLTPELFQKMPSQKSKRGPHTGPPRHRKKKRMCHNGFL